MEIINWKLASHPLNWVVIFMMVFLFVLAVHFLVSYNNAPKTDPQQ